MKLAVDGSIFDKQAVGGISRLFREILPIMTGLDPSLHIDILTSHRHISLPRNSQINLNKLTYWQKFLRPGKFFVQSREQGRRNALSNWLGENNIDVFHSTYYWVPQTLSFPKVVTLYDLIHEKFPQLFFRQRDIRFIKDKEKAISAADLVICISATTKKDAINSYDISPSKLVAIPLGVSSIFQVLKDSELTDCENCPFILFVGRRDGYKNFLTLIKAYSRWPLRNAIKLLAVGSPWTNDEINLIKDLKLERHILLRTAVTDLELVQLYNQAAAFIFPSIYEGFGLPILEAMRCGCPVVGSNIPSTHEIAGDLIYYFNPGSPDDLLHSLDKAIQENRNSKRIQEGIQLAASYTWEKNAKQTLEVLHAFS